MFSGVGDHCSSIDALILNSAAFAALQDIQVDQLFHVQHRPIHATFEWRRSCQVGHILRKFAAFNLDAVPVRSNKTEFREFENQAKRVWDVQFAPSSDVGDVDQQWHHANRFCVDTLLQAGATWEDGPRARAQPPVFKPKQHCPGQTPSRCATTLRLSWLYNSLRAVHELQMRLGRPSNTNVDAWVTFRTVNKLRSRLDKFKYPGVWSPFHLPSLVVLDHCAHWLHQVICDVEHALKLSRIRLWKSKVQQSLAHHKSYIFKHLRNKVLDEPANLVTDKDNNVVFQPDCAIAEINSQWDDVYSVNAGYPHPLRMLEIVWPYIQTKTHDACVPELTAHDLQQVVLDRNPLSAPGLDGWRTTELQSLPMVCFEPFAELFRRLERNEVALPHALVCARQMILNKNGSSCPLQKRIISVLPILMLAYTGCRFRHLKQWQMNSMPMALQGGIPKRRMDAVHTHMKLVIDRAVADHVPVIGVKLDKAKCFDRIIPAYASALMLSYGVPSFVVNIFVKLYDGLHRHLSYKSWIAPVATRPANGVAQGCSLSLIAINVYMKTWCHLLECLPEVTVKAFVDDSYLWTHLHNSHLLARAVHVTKMWDEISGQKLNDGKSTIWGTSAKARKVVKSMFPHMKLALAFDVLGTLVRTANVSTAFLTDAKVAKIIADTKNIGVLPIPMQAKSHLVGAKVLTQCTYGAAINCLPKPIASKIQNAVASTFWSKRPHWRNKWLLFALLHKPYRVEPFHAGAYSAIMDFHRFIRANPDFHHVCSHLLSQIAANKFNYLRTVVESFNLLGIRLQNDLSISFHGSKPIPLFDCHTKDLKKTLQLLVRNACYHQAAHHTRKDFHKPTGVLDFDLTATFWRHSKLSFQSDIPASAFFDAQVVGCQLTKDRLYAASCVDDPCCRFCNFEKESLEHIVCDCTLVKRKFGTHPSHEFGPNFELLGIVEHPFSVIAHRLQWSDPQNIDVASLINSEQVTLLWTDGSIFWSEIHWLTTGGYAVVNAELEVLRSGPVFHWALSSYTTELWAILQACALATSRIVIHSDCQAVVGQCWLACEYGYVPDDWSHVAWWKFFIHLWKNKFGSDADALDIVWVPAHVYDGVPLHLVTPDMAELKDTSLLNIQCNRKADFAAKDAAVACSIVHPDMKSEVRQAILGRQEFLTKIAFALGLECDVPLPPEKFNERDELDVDSDRAIISYFNGWFWEDKCKHYNVRIAIPDGCTPPAKWTFSPEDWNTFVRFLRQLRWTSDPAMMVSYAELACVFAVRGYKWSSYNDGVTLFSELIPQVRKAFFWLRRAQNISLPGKNETQKAKRLGKKTLFSLANPNKLQRLYCPSERGRKWV